MWHSYGAEGSLVTTLHKNITFWCGHSQITAYRPALQAQDGWHA